ncbi:hypothetical protein Tco_1212009 [Tanacetum coccineum]
MQVALSSHSKLVESGRSDELSKMYNIRDRLYHDDTPSDNFYVTCSSPSVGFGLIFKVEDLFDLCYENVLVIFKRLTTAVDLCHVVSKDKFVDLCYENVLVIFKRLTTAVDLCHVVSKDKFVDIFVGVKKKHCRNHLK